MEKHFCALGCQSTNKLYIFPSRRNDNERRKLWLDFFDMEEPNIECVFACDRHFSHFQTTNKGIKSDAVPDVPIICDAAALPYKRKPTYWRKNVVVVTPSDPEFVIYRHETGVFPQNLFDVSNTAQPVIQVPMIKSVSCSMSTQTNTRLCGSVQISDILEEYRLNCFYCCEIFPLEKWSNFVDHLKKKHFKKEEAFKMSKYLSHDHDYTPIKSPSNSPLKPEIKFNMISNPIIQVPPPQPVFREPILLPPLLAKPQKTHVKKVKSNFNTENLPPPPTLLAKPQQPQNKPFNISLADKLINFLNETLLNPNLLHTEEDNIVIIKNSPSNDIETSDFLQNIMDCSNLMDQNCVGDVKSNKSTPSISSTKYTRPIYTLSHGQQNIPKRRHSVSHAFLPLSRNRRAKLARQTLKNINVFENIYKTVKTRPPKVDDEEINDLKDLSENGQKTSIQTPLSRFLKRTETEPKPFNIESIKQKSTELVFEFTPEDIIVSLLDSIKNYPVLWQFHDHPFNKDYNKAIAEICQTINVKWSLNITPLKMRRSINRILRFYRFMLPRENVEKFDNYFDKCALFLPPLADEIPRARCTYCSICFKRDTDLRKHLIEKHKCLKWPYNCQKCHERFRERDEYELHKHLLHFKEVFKCDQCNKRFDRRMLYNKHVSSHQRTIQRRIEALTKPVQYSHECNVCQKKFKSYSDLNRHQYYHKERPVFKCHLCPKEYSLKTTLHFHLKRHRKEVDFVCEVCGKGFIRQSYLDEHMNTHTGAKITCNICNLKLRKCSLSRHLRLVHVATEGTIESTYRAQCYQYKKFLNPKTYIERNDNKPVTRSAEKLPRNYGCKICKIQFDGLKSLKDHNKQFHSDVQTIPCRICQIDFKRTHNLRSHYRYKHNLNNYQIFNLVDQNQDLNTVLAMKQEQTADVTMAECIAYKLNKKYDNINQSHSPDDENCFGPERMNSDKIQDEIMKAVENIDKQDMKIDDDHSMNDFFIDLLKQ